jgi:O6-methylguanine-DNA--protein-cysteine methyltransferase
VAGLCCNVFVVGWIDYLTKKLPFIMKLQIDRIESPLGTILLVADETSLCALDFVGYEARMMGLLQKRYPSVELIETIDPQGFSSKVHAYLAGDYGSLTQVATYRHSVKKLLQRSKDK